jgi:hypothetical protein
MVQLLVFLMGIVKKSFTEKREIAPVAQLDRASDFGSEGLGFESLRAHFTFKHKITNRLIPNQKQLTDLVISYFCFLTTSVSILVLLTVSVTE